MNRTRVLVVLLCLSVLANVILIGYFVGREARNNLESEESSRGFSHLLNGLPAERREEFSPLIDKHRATNREVYNRISVTRNKLWRILQQENLEHGELVEASRAHAEALALARQTYDKFFIDVFLQLSFEERKELFEKNREAARRQRSRENETRTDDKLAE